MGMAVSVAGVRGAANAQRREPAFYLFARYPLCAAVLRRRAARRLGWNSLSRTRERLG